MTITELEQRIEMLQTELQKANGAVASLAEQLEKAKINLHTINGHFTEASFQLQIMKNEQAAAAAHTDSVVSDHVQ